MHRVTKLPAIGLPLLVLLLAGFNNAFASVKPGNYAATADFGTFLILVDAGGTNVTEIEYEFSEWSCGIVTRSGTLKITSGSGWAISDDEFTIRNSLSFDPNVQETLTISGTFSGTGDQISGSWEANIRGTTCTGTWEAAWIASVAVENPDSVPTQFALEQNYPNPFNPSTTIGYAVPTPAAVTLTVYDLLGHEVRTLVEGYKRPGRHTVVFEAKGLPNGLYLYRLKAGPYMETRRLVLLQ